jgi:hypothetical protein
MMRYLKLLGGLLFAAALTACGGGGGSPGATPNNPGGGTTKAVPASLEVFTSSATLSSASNSSLTFTVVVKDSGNQAIPAQTVTFSASSGSLQGALPPPATGLAGQPVTGVSLQPGSDRSIRDITVTVRAGGVSKDVVIPVVGTTVSLAGDSSIILGGTTTFTARAVDSAGQPIPNAQLTLTSALGNGLSASTLTTNPQGAATFVYAASRSGLDTLTVSGLGVSSASFISVSSDEFRFVGPAAGTLIPIGVGQPVVVRFLSGGAPVAGATINFSTTRGTVNPPSVVTAADGTAATTVISSSSGPANIVAQAPGAQTTLPVTFVATSPATLILQANPGAVPPNLAGSTTNQSTLQAKVRDAAGNPVSGRIVNFTAIVDGSQGIISPGSSVTDASGVATAQFIPGGLTTAGNGVVIQASVPGTGVAGTANLTVSTQALFISIAEGNTITNLDENTYEKPFSVYVTDVNGAPAVNRVVTLSVWADEYGKGFLTFADDKWGYGGTPTWCLNEDANRNGILDAGEDGPANPQGNGNGKLEPGLPVVISPATVTTDNTGFAQFKLQYGENFALWADTTITARAVVGGTESVATRKYFLLMSAADASNEATPANARSPFGTATQCTDPR